jgi:hypothetical protein
LLRRVNFLISRAKGGSAPIPRATSLAPPLHFTPPLDRRRDRHLLGRPQSQYALGGLTMKVCCRGLGALASLGAIVSVQAAEIHYRQNNKGEVIEISELYKDSDCGSRTAVPVSGKVVKREFADDAVKISHFVVEHSDGTREIVNVEVPEGLSQTTRGNVLIGLQRLLREGRTVHGLVTLCGAAGRVEMLKEIR